jgi:hypothetical protein
MAENFKERFSAFSEKLKLGSSEVGRKVTERMKELFQVSTQADKLVEEATIENLEGPDWEKSLELCDLVNSEQVSGQDAVRAIKKRIMLKNTRIQFLALTLLETCVKNCEKMFSEVASERVLDEMVKMIDDRQTAVENRDKALKLIEAWGESTEELRYLPIFEETLKSLKSRGIVFPGRDTESLAPIFTPPQSISRLATEGSGSFNADSFGLREAGGLSQSGFSPEETKEVFDVSRNSVELLSTVLTSSPQQEALQEELTLALVEQCRQSQFKIQRIIESAGDNDPNIFEALNVNDELQHVLIKYEEMSHSNSGEQLQAENQPDFARVEALEEDDPTHGVGEESVLVRNRIPKTSTSSAHDDAAMADLDEMIFGKNDSTQGAGKKSSDDLITF